MTGHSLCNIAGDIGAIVWLAPRTIVDQVTVASIVTVTSFTPAKPPWRPEISFRVHVTSLSTNPSALMAVSIGDFLSAGARTSGQRGHFGRPRRPEKPKQTSAREGFPGHLLPWRPLLKLSALVRPR